MREPSEELLRAMTDAAAKDSVTEDRLHHLIMKATEVRDLEKEISDLERRMDDLKATRHALLTSTLPQMMDQIGVSTITVEASGNLPSCKFTVRPYYSANISAKWPQSRRSDAYAWLDGHGAGDLIKTTVEAAFPREERSKAIETARLLQDSGANVTVDERVHSGTLTSWLRETVETGGDLPPLDVIGGAVGRIVKIEEAK